MSLDGYELAADLSQLKIIGAVDLPMLAYVYAQINNAVASTAAGDAAAFAAPHGVANPVGPLWSELRDQLQNVLGRTSLALRAAGITVEHIAQVYYDTDAEAAQAIDGVWKNGELPREMLQPTEIVPPGQPQPVVMVGLV